MQTSPDPVYPAAHRRPKARSLSNHMLELEKDVQYAEYANVQYMKFVQYMKYD